MQGELLAPRTIRIHLHGALEQRFGGPFDLGVSSGGSALRVMMTMLPGFREMLSAGEWHVLRGTIDQGRSLDTVSLHLKIPFGGELHVMPVGMGGKGGGIFKAVVGVALVAAAFALAPPLAGAGAGLDFGAGVSVFGTSLGFSYGQMAIAGGLMLLAGVTSMLSPQPKKPVDNSNTQSFLLGGQLNTTGQGVPVPVVYGQMMVGSVTVSVGYYAEVYSNITAEPPGVDGNVAGPGEIITGSGGGGKGGGGSGSSGAVDDPNTLRSKALVRIIDVLSEGPIGGLVNGAQSIYFNGTPLQAADGTFNFQGVSWDFRTGVPDQDPVSGFSAAEQTVSLGGGSGVQVTQADGPYIVAISEAVANGANAVRLIIQIPALYTVSTKTGALQYGPTLNILFDIQPIGGAWTNVVNDFIVGGKCTSPYQRAYRVELPASTTGWQVRMTRNAADDANDTTASETFFFGYVLITDHAIQYDDTAYIALVIDSESFGSSVPTRRYIINGIQVAVPLNYNVAARSFASSGPGTSGGTWDLVSTYPATVDDPCWNLLDMLSNDRYGMGIDQASIEGARADLYIISQYCNTSVIDGFGGYEPRYTMNCVIATQQDAFTAIQTMVSAFRGMVYWGLGRLVVTADMPDSIAKVVTQANVIDGDFTYEGTPLNQRHTVYRVTWRDPSNLWTPTVEVVEDTEQVGTRTFIPVDIVAFGCTSRGLAHRLGKWALYTERAQTETVSYKAGLYHLDLLPGEIIAQTDPHYFGTRFGGRIRASTANSVTLDALFTADPAQTYQIYMAQPNGEVALTPVSYFSADPSGTLTVVNLSRNVFPIPIISSDYLLLGTSSYPRQFRVVAVSETQRGIFGITALIHDPTKYDWVENGVTLSLPTYYSANNLPALLTEPLPAPQNISVQAYMVGLGSVTVQRATVSFTPIPDIRITGYQAVASALLGAIGPGALLFASAPYSPIDIDNLQAGDYTFGVRAVGANGQVSAWTYSTPLVITNQSTPPGAVQDLRATGGTRRVQLTWLPPAISSVYYYEIWRSNTDTGAAPDATGFLIAQATGSSYLDADSDTLIPNSTWYYWVRPVTTTGTYGPFAGPAGATTTLLIADDIADGILNTAKFAQGLTPVRLITSLSAIGDSNGQLAVNEQDSRLYSWDSATASWVPVVDTSKLSGLISTLQINDAAITTAKIAIAAIEPQLIAAGAVTSTAIAAGSISTPAIVAGAITTATIAVGAITAQTIAAGAVTTPAIAAGAITTDTLAVGAVTATNILAKTITADQIQDNSITTAVISAGAINSNQIAAQAIETYMLADTFQLSEESQIGLAVIGTAQIQNLVVTTSNLAPNSVTSFYEAAWSGQNVGISQTIGYDVLGANQFFILTEMAVPVGASGDGSFTPIVLLFTQNQTSYSSGLPPAALLRIPGNGGTQYKNMTGLGFDNPIGEGAIAHGGVVTYLFGFLDPSNVGSVGVSGAYFMAGLVINK